ALVAELSAHGLPARFVPLSAFASPSLGDSDATLVIFSQRLSPNARLALRASPRFASTIVCTTVDDATLRERGGAGLEVVTRRLPDLNEPPTLVRVLGPPCATLDALRLAAQLLALAGVPPRFDDDAISAAVTALDDRADDIAAQCAAALADYGDDEVVFVTVGGYDAWVRGIRCTWQEGLLVARPPIYDALAFAHGPLQQLYPRRAAIIALGCDGDDPRVLERLRATLAPQHRFVELRSHLAAPLSVLEHDAMVGWLVHAALQRAPRDLFQWPGKGADGPLYKLGELRDDSDGSAQA
ncbi:MAG: hypothetical protein KC503_36785, partial [Myxococcales bacterium]|nr:hypothetical protein [Myxococcales bacterium]